jgi:hypothetical protein
MCLLFPSFTLIFPWIAIDTSSGSNFRSIMFRLPSTCFPCDASVICNMWRVFLFPHLPIYIGQAVKTFNITSVEHIEATRNGNSDSVYYRAFTPPLGRDIILLVCMSFSLFGPVSISSAVSFLSAHLWMTAWTFHWQRFQWSHISGCMDKKIIFTYKDRVRFQTLVFLFWILAGYWKSSNNNKIDQK